LTLFVSWRYTVAATGVAMLIVTTALVATGRVKVRFFPNAEADNVVATLTMPQGTPYETTAAAIDRLELAAQTTADEFKADLKTEGGRPFRHIFSSLGAQPFGASRGHSSSRRSGGSGLSHLAEVNIELAPAQNRAFSGVQVLERWRELAGPIPDAVELLYSSDLFAAAQPIDIELSGPDLDQLRAAADRLKAELENYPGVFDVADSFRPGKVELELDIRPAAEALGLSRRDLARQVRQAFYGEEAQVIQRGREDASVYVRFPLSERRSIGDVENMRIRTPEGGEVPFSAVASVRHGRSYESIQRAERRRTINITGEVDRQKANPNESLASLEAGPLLRLESDYPGLHYSLEGEQREQRETFGALLRGLAVALLVIYALIAIPLASYIQPLIVMSAIPFGIAGAVWAHYLLSMDLSFMSLLGIVALVGVVVNDSLVLVDYVNRRRREGAGTREAAQNAGIDRFRAILLTSLTTFAGLIPLLLERSLQAQFLIPMAVSLGFGVLLATGVSLVLVPCVYVIIDDAALAISRRRERRIAADSDGQEPGSSAARSS
ncbi:MAG: efflux RND transporter permease subunit, partial [Myxococcales bacterium]